MSAVTFFALVSCDRPGAGEKREKTWPSHLKHLKLHAAAMRVGGPFASPEGGIVGALFVIDVADEAAARTWVADEPFHIANVPEESRQALATDEARARARRWRRRSRAGRIQLEQEHL